jgi:hypothetical protein
MLPTEIPSVQQAGAEQPVLQNPENSETVLAGNTVFMQLFSQIRGDDACVVYFKYYQLTRSYTVFLFYTTGVVVRTGGQLLSADRDTAVESLIRYTNEAEGGFPKLEQSGVYPLGAFTHTLGGSIEAVTFTLEYNIDPPAEYKGVFNDDGSLVLTHDGNSTEYYLLGFFENGAFNAVY